MTKKLFSHTELPIANVDLKGPYTFEPKLLFSENSRYVIDYDVELSNGKNLQREFVWTIEQKRNLIESILKKLTLPEFHIVQYKSADAESGKSIETIIKVIDGKQRLSTIQQFMNDEFTFFWNGIEYLYSEFDENTQYFIWNLDLRFKVVFEYDDTKLSDKQLIDWFYMVNFAGTQQDKSHLDNLYASIK